MILVGKKYKKKVEALFMLLAKKERGQSPFHVVGKKEAKVPFVLWMIFKVVKYGKSYDIFFMGL